MIRDILEPDADTIASTDNMIQLSIAISLKRIADALEAQQADIKLRADGSHGFVGTFARTTKP